MKPCNVVIKTRIANTLPTLPGACAGGGTEFCDIVQYAPVGQVVLTIFPGLPPPAAAAVLSAGFLPSMDPLRRLPQAELQPWEAMAAALPSLLAVGRARKPLETLPVLSIGLVVC